MYYLFLRYYSKKSFNFQPKVCIEKVKANPDLVFLKDHWYYNEEELLKLVQICFDWKEQGTVL